MREWQLGQEYDTQLCKCRCMHLLYIALMISWQRIQQIKNITEKEKFPLRSKSFLLHVSPRNIPLFTAKSLMTEQHSVSPSEAVWRSVPGVGSPPPNHTEHYGSSWAELCKAWKRNPPSCRPATRTAVAFSHWTTQTLAQRPPTWGCGARQWPWGSHWPCHYRCPTGGSSLTDRGEGGGEGEGKGKAGGGGEGEMEGKGKAGGGGGPQCRSSVP